MKVLTLIALLSMAALTLAQPPDTLWTRTYGNISNDFFTSVQQTSDGGYIVAGYTESYGAGGADVWLIKTDDSGSETWTKTFGGNDEDGGWDVEQADDGGYIITGATVSYGSGLTDVWLIKTDSNGDSLWSQTFGGSGADEGHSIEQTSDGGFIIIGETESFGAGSFDIWLIKTDSLGIEEWNQTFGGGDYDYGCCVQQTTDGGYVITGNTSSYGAGSSDAWLINTDANGNQQWNHTFGGTGPDGGGDVQQTTDSGYIISGWTTSYGVGIGDVWLIKTDSLGNEEWNQTFGGSEWDHGNSVQQTTDGGYIITGETSSYGAGQEDNWVIKTDHLGNDLWISIFGGSERDVAMQVQQTDDGGYIIAGHTYSYGAGFADGWLIRLDSETSVELDPGLHHPSEFILHQPYPNPFNPSTRITYDLPSPSSVTLEVYDLLGRLIETLFNGEQPAGSHSVLFDGSALPSGLYFYRLQTSNFVQTQKMVLLK